MKLLFYSPALMLIVIFLIGCAKDHEANKIPDPVFSALALPAHTRSSTPDLVRGSDGALYISWVEEHDDTLASLHLSKFDNGKWTASQKIAAGNNWFLNWADFPTIAIRGQHMAASYLERSGPGAYSYDVKITTSNDFGNTWSTPFTAHTDATESEHGFVTLLPWTGAPAPAFAAVWLDGRHTVGSTDHHGAMTIRSMFFDLQGNRNEETELDIKTCDCCQTAAILTGPAEILVAYRDRSDDEIRDIATVRYTNTDGQGDWRESAIVHADGWQISGCPVNGPALANSKDQVAITWFTGANDHPRIQLSLSTDRGETFLPPVVIADTSKLGRVDVAFADHNTILVTWLEETIAGANIMLQVVHIEKDKSLRPSASFVVAETSPGRKSGFPQMAAGQDHILFAWTELVSSTETTVRTAYIDRASF